MTTARILLSAIALAASLGGAGVAMAQVQPPVLTDAAPLPAEERGSTGAIVLENSLVRAQRDKAFERAGSRTGVATVGRGVLRATMRAQAQADLAQARESEAVEFYRRGAASSTPK
jgi:hypothetical protein